MGKRARHARRCVRHYFPAGQCVRAWRRTSCSGSALDPDPEESFRLYQGLIKAEYDRLADEYGLVRVDATQHLIQQQRVMRELVKPHLGSVMRTDGGQMQDALREAGVRGRYLPPGMSSRATGP